MCKPTSFAVEYSINPWMKKDTQVDLKLAKKQWSILKQTVEMLGGRVKVIEQSPDMLDMVFAADCGIAYQNKIVLSNFKYPQRQRERSIYRKWFEQNDYEINFLGDNLKLEGGDCVIWKDYLIGGYGYRSDKFAIERAADLLELKCITLKLQKEKFYHLDTCLSVLDDLGNSIYYPSAFSKKEISMLPFEPILVDVRDAENFVCNIVKVEDNLIMTKASDPMTALLTEMGFSVHSVDMSEFIKAGGSSKCLVFNL